MKDILFLTLYLICAFNVNTIISVIWSHLKFFCHLLQQFFLPLSFVELSIAAPSQHIPVKMTVELSCSPRTLLLTITISVLSGALKEKPCYSPTMGCCLFNCLYCCSWDLVKIILNDCCLDSFIMKPYTQVIHPFSLPTHLLSFFSINCLLTGVLPAQIIHFLHWHTIFHYRNIYVYHIYITLFANLCQKSTVCVFPVVFLLHVFRILADQLCSDQYRDKWKHAFHQYMFIPAE